jgi:hypothetical protein
MKSVINSLFKHPPNFTPYSFHTLFTLDRYVIIHHEFYATASHCNTSESKKSSVEAPIKTRADKKSSWDDV